MTALAIAAAIVGRFLPDWHDALGWDGPDSLIDPRACHPDREHAGEDQGEGQGRRSNHIEVNNR